jgi:tRNA(Ile)-lysidine synthetase-like protein
MQRTAHPEVATVPGPARGGSVPIAVRRHWLVGEIERRLRIRGGVSAGAKLAVGVSGGADSTALLLGCAALRERGRAETPGTPSVRPLAVHVHHHLRPSDDDDAAFVTELCGRYELELRVEHIRPGSMAGNLAANARRLRYRALQRAARGWGARFVAVAHHGDDQLETMLMALCRGAGLDGLAGMRPVRPLEDGVMLVRPLLWARRADCESLCRAAGVQWRRDPSNEDLGQRRARLRRDVLPVLEALWPEAPKRAAGMADAVAAARAALADELQRTFGGADTRSWDRTALAGLPVAVICAGLRRAALRAVPDCADEIGQAHLLPAADAIRDTDRRPRTFEWPRGLKVIVTARAVELVGEG